VKTYKHWRIIDTLPDGWAEDKTVGTPLFGHVFVTNGKSVLKGQERALIAVEKARRGKT
jgi:hypothetical protein